MEEDNSTKKNRFFRNLEHSKYIRKYSLLFQSILLITIIVGLCQIYFIFLSLSKHIEYIDIQATIIFLISILTTLFVLTNENDIELIIDFAQNIPKHLNEHALGLNIGPYPIICLRNKGKTNYAIDYIKAFDIITKEQIKFLDKDNGKCILQQKMFISPQEDYRIAFLNDREADIVIGLSRLLYKKKVILRIRLEDYTNSDGRPKYTILYNGTKLNYLALT